MLVGKGWEAVKTPHARAWASGLWCTARHKRGPAACWHGGCKGGDMKRGANAKAVPGPRKGEMLTAHLAAASMSEANHWSGGKTTLKASRPGRAGAWQGPAVLLGRRGWRGGACMPWSSS
jgi:hypothetical protein